MTRLVLVEDHVLVRQSIRAFLQGEGFEVVGEGGTGIEGVQLARDLQPDLVIMDIHLPEMSGIEAARQIRKEHPHIYLVVLTAYNEKAYQRALREAGADGFVLKTAEFSELLTVIQKVLQKSNKPSVVPKPNVLIGSHENNRTLTDREREVLVYVAKGWTNKQIGAHLEISDRTVQVHLQAIYHKFDVTNRTEAVLRGLMLGIITPLDGATE